MASIYQSSIQDNVVPASNAPVHPNRIPTIYFGISIKRLVSLFILSMGLYRYYWSYKNWRIIKETERPDISPFWRSVLGIFFCYELFEYIVKNATQYPHKRSFSPTRLAVWYIILHVIGLGFIKIFLLASAQRAILFNNSQVIQNYQPVKSYTHAEVALVAIGILVWGMVIVAAMVD